MRALEFITGHVTYNLAYTKILQTIATYDFFRLEMANIANVLV